MFDLSSTQRKNLNLHNRIDYIDVDYLGIDYLEFYNKEHQNLYVQ